MTATNSNSLCSKNGTLGLVSRNLLVLKISDRPLDFQTKHQLLFTCKYQTLMFPAAAKNLCLFGKNCTLNNEVIWCFIKSQMTLKRTNFAMSRPPATIEQGGFDTPELERIHIGWKPILIDHWYFIVCLFMGRIAPLLDESNLKRKAKNTQC